MASQNKLYFVQDVDVSSFIISDCEVSAKFAFHMEFGCYPRDTFEIQDEFCPLASASFVEEGTNKFISTIWDEYKRDCTSRMISWKERKNA